FTSIDQPMTCAHTHHASVSLNDGTVMVIGGLLFMQQPSNLAEIFDPSTRTFTNVQMVSARDGFSATRLPLSGKVLVAGGLASSCTLSDPCVIQCSGQPTLSVPAELYDPNTGAFATTGAMKIPRRDHVAALLGDGRVLIASGDNTSGAVAMAEIYNP